MRPFLRDGDILHVTADDGLPARGRILVYRRGDRICAHRLVGMGTGADGGATYRAAADAERRDVEAVGPERVLGWVVQAEREGEIWVPSRRLGWFWFRIRPLRRLGITLRHLLRRAAAGRRRTDPA